MKKEADHIHHHTGGLENQFIKSLWFKVIHHHTGGLEIPERFISRSVTIHHHTGGLEIVVSVVVVV